MNLYPARTRRERILVFGVEGTGKSAFILRLALAYPFGKFHVVDTEYGSYDALMAGGTNDDPTLFQRLHPDNGGNVYVTEVDMDDWVGMKEAAIKINAEMDRDDWFVYDSMTPTWDACQEWFTNEIFDQGIDEYFMQVRKAKAVAEQAGAKKTANLGALEGWKDYGVINPQYFGLYKILLRSPGHIYWTAEQTKISDEDDKDEETKKLYGSSGVKPKGQKRLGHMTHTVLRLTRTQTGDWQMNTIKDRGRATMERVDVKDPAMDYFFRVAGWRPKALEG